MFGISKSPCKLLCVSLAITFLSACSTVVKVSPNIYADNQNECVVLLHGLWRSGFAMNSIENHLEAHGYQTVNVDYPSTDFDIKTLSQDFLAPAVVECKSKSVSGKVHIVSHSMGGILTRSYLQSNRLPEGSRVVMLSPPNQGSELSQRFGDKAWYECLLGPAGTSLTKTESGALPDLKEVDEPLGIIAAYRTWSLWPETWLPAPNDGTVSVKSMVLPEMDDFVAVNVGHAMMRYDDLVQQHIVEFLQRGKFESSLMNQQDLDIVRQAKAPQN